VHGSDNRASLDGIATAPDRIFWGLNRPHPILWGHPIPYDGDLLGRFMVWAGDDATRLQVLVDNPAKFYGSES
jgi:predicted TIM-barrel fold metal-dependent hydrolase